MSIDMHVYLMLAFWALLGCIRSEAWEKEKESMKNDLGIDAVVREALEAFHVPGIAVGLVVDGEIVFAKGYGLRDAHRGLPATEKTVFPVASCTKSFTSFLLSQLVEEGKISWDDPVVRYIPEFRFGDSKLSSQVTIRDLIAHRTGLARHDVIWHSVMDLSRSDVLDLISKLEPSSGLREKFEYNNFMYIVAGAVIERVTHRTWEEEMTVRILIPLGMNDSDLSIEELQRCDDFSLPYAEIDGEIQEVPFRDLHLHGSASALNSNVLDMAKWILAQIPSDQGKSETTLREMHSIHMPFSNPPKEGQIPFELGYGLGWFVGTFRDHSWINHGGVIDGFFSEVSLLPNRRIGLVVLTNSSTDGRYAVSYIRNTLFDRLLGFEETDWMKIIQEERRQSKDAMKKRENRMFTNPEELKKYEGKYVHPAYGAIQIQREGGHLTARLGKMDAALNLKRGPVFEAEYPSLLIYGINPVVEFLFFNEELHVPFEHCHSAKPIVFKKI